METFWFLANGIYFAQVYLSLCIIEDTSRQVAEAGYNFLTGGWRTSHIFSQDCYLGLCSPLRNNGCWRKSWTSLEKKDSISQHVLSEYPVPWCKEGKSAQLQNVRHQYLNCKKQVVDQSKGEKDRFGWFQLRHGYFGRPPKSVLLCL